jgi:hypothetical protein
MSTAARTFAFRNPVASNPIPKPHPFAVAPANKGCRETVRQFTFEGPRDKSRSRRYTPPLLAQVLADRAFGGMAMTTLSFHEYLVNQNKMSQMLPASGLVGVAAAQPHEVDWLKKAIPEPPLQTPSPQEESRGHAVETPLKGHWHQPGGRCKSRIDLCRVDVLSSGRFDQAAQ